MDDENIPSYAPSNKNNLNKSNQGSQNSDSPIQNTPNSNSTNQDMPNSGLSNSDSTNQDMPNYNLQSTNKTKKSKKIIIIPIIIILILALGVEAFFFFWGNKNYNNINSYNYWFSSSTPHCDTNIKTSKPNSTNFFNQICGTSNGYTYKDSATNIDGMVNGAVESYLINYANNKGENIKLIASSFNDQNKQSKYFNNNNKNKNSYIWQNKTAVYIAIGNNAAKFAKSLNV